MIKYLTVTLHLSSFLYIINLRTNERGLKMGKEITTQNKILGKTFFWMFLGLLGSAIIAWYTYSSGLFIKIVFEGYFSILLIVELVAVLVFSLLFKKLSPTLVGILYFIYAMLNGVTLSVVFAVYELSSVVYLFVIAALIFGALSFLGYKTDKNLSNNWNPYITVFLLAGIILSLINLIFIKSSTFDLILDWIILVLFFGITVYDINKIKILQSDESLDHDKIHIYCAMQLYLDFVNIFLRILSIFGKRRD